MNREELKKFLHYDPESGFLIRLISRQGCNAGERAGRLHSNGYRYVSYNYKMYREHRLIWFYVTGEWPKNQIHHKNDIRDDNRWINLELATNQQNQARKGLQKNNKTGYKGISFDRNCPRKCFRVRIQVNRKEIYLGNFDNLKEARDAYRIAARMYFGKFARGE
jgi:HNH endonuclease